MKWHRPSRMFVGCLVLVFVWFDGAMALLIFDNTGRTYRPHNPLAWYLGYTGVLLALIAVAIVVSGFTDDDRERHERI